MKKVLQAAVSGIFPSAVAFLLILIVKGFWSGDSTWYSAIGMAYASIAMIVIGAGFGIASLIYETELPLPLKALIHMGIGTAVMLITSIVIGWIDFSRGWLPCIAVALVQITVAFLFWFFSCVRIVRDAKKMNKKIAENQ